MSSDTNLIFRLVESFPRLFRGSPPEIDSYIENGWYQLVLELCTQIDEVLSNDQTQHIHILQIKEKFGGLRFYMRMTVVNADAEIPVDTVEPIDLHTRLAVVRLIEEAEQRSVEICKVCGAPGQRNSSGWLQTLCPIHRKVI